MSICLYYKSAAVAACAHWQGPDRTPLSERHEAAPGKALSASTERLPTVRPTLLHQRHRKRAIPTLAEPPTLGSELDGRWRLSTVQKRRNYHKYAFTERNISSSHHWEKRTASAYLTQRHMCLDWAFIPNRNDTTLSVEPSKSPSPIADMRHYLTAHRR